MADVRARCESEGRDPATLRFSVYTRDEDFLEPGRRRTDLIAEFAGIGIDRLICFPTKRQPTLEAQHASRTTAWRPAWSSEPDNATSGRADDGGSRRAGRREPAPRILGDRVRSDLGTRALYTSDASLYRVLPGARRGAGRRG